MTLILHIKFILLKITLNLLNVFNREPELQTLDLLVFTSLGRPNKRHCRVACWEF